MIYSYRFVSPLPHTVALFPSICWLVLSMAGATISVSAPGLVCSPCETDTQQESNDVVDESYESPKYIHPLRKALLKAVKETWERDCEKFKPGSPPFAVSTVESCLYPFLAGRVRVKKTEDDLLIARSTLKRLGDALVTLFLRHLTDDAGCRGKARVLYTKHLMGSKISRSIKQRMLSFPLLKLLRLCVSVTSYDNTSDADSITRSYQAFESSNHEEINSLLNIEALTDDVSSTVVPALNKLEIRELD